MDPSAGQKGECRVHPSQAVTSPTAENIMYMKGRSVVTTPLHLKVKLFY